jgi:hypothetical protein
MAHKIDHVSPLKLIAADLCLGANRGCLSRFTQMPLLRGMVVCRRLLTVALHTTARRPWVWGLHSRGCGVKYPTGCVTDGSHTLGLQLNIENILSFKLLSQKVQPRLLAVNPRYLAVLEHVCARVRL